MTGKVSVGRWSARFGVVLTALILVSCTSAGGPSRPAGPQTQAPPVRTEQPVATAPTNTTVPEHMKGREPVRVALLLPLSAKNSEIRQVAGALLDAAQLAVFEVNNPNLLLMPKDTGGTPAGAEIAAREALNEGAELVLGPLLRESVMAVAPLAQAAGVQVISFSTDSGVSGNGVYLLSFQPEQEVQRVTRYAISQNRHRFAALVPISDYGNRVRDSFIKSVDMSGGRVIAVQPYQRRPEEMFDPVKSLANYQKQALGGGVGVGGEPPVAPPPPSQGTLGGPGVDPAAQYQVGQLSRLLDYQTYSEAPFDAVLLPEGGMLLRALAPLLPYFDVDPKQVKFLGTGLWDDPVIGKEPALVGGWFAAPPPDARSAFVSRFKNSYGRTPPRIASLAFDGVALSGALARLPAGQRFSQATLTNPNGFSGIDGIFRFTPDGQTERGLAVMEVTSKGFVVVDPAPSSFEASKTGF